MTFRLWSRIVFLCTKDAPSQTWWNAVSRLALVQSEAEQLNDISNYLNLEYSLPKSHIPHFMLCAPTHTHPLSRKFPGRLEAAPTKQPEKGPRWQLRGARGEARTRITINEVNRIPAKCAVRTVFARSLVVCWGHIELVRWSSPFENEACLTWCSDTCSWRFAMKTFSRLLLSINLSLPRT